MFKAERQRRILEIIERDVSVDIGLLVSDLQVTKMTIWRDLKELEEHKLITRMRGGAMRRDVANEPTYEIKRPAMQDAKRRIASRVVREFVRPGLSMALDGGTTIGELARQLPSCRLSVLTNSIPITNELIRMAGHNSIHCSGGLLREESATLVGKEAVTFFSRRKTDIFFLSATGLSLESGITDPNPMEIEVKQVMACSARQVVLLLDSSKVGTESLMEVLPLEKIDFLVCDRPLSTDHAALLAGKGVKVIVA